MKASAEGVLYIVDDDQLMRAALQRLLSADGFRLECFGSGSEFLEEAPLDSPGCCLLDCRMPGMSGFDVHAQLMRRGSAMSVVFLTGDADLSEAVVAMRNGAVDYLQKPFDRGQLVRRLRGALDRSRQAYEQVLEQARARDRAAHLTQRENQVLRFIIGGHTNKQMARLIGCSHRTIEVHRTNLMRKLDAAKVPDLVRFAFMLDSLAQSNP